MKLTKIIALYGAANTGKSTTLNYLINLLAKTEAVGNHAEVTVADCGDVRKLDDTPKLFVLNGLKIAVTPSGDNGHELDKNIVFIKDCDCDIAVTASRTKGSSVETLNNFAKAAGIKVEWIKKEYCDTAEMAQCNRKQAFNIFQNLITKIS